MYVAMATAVHMDYILPLKQGTSFQMLLQTRDARKRAICAVYEIAYTSNLQKLGSILEILLLASLYKCHMLTQQFDIRTSLTMLSDIMLKTHRSYLCYL